MSIVYVIFNANRYINFNMLLTNYGKQSIIRDKGSDHNAERHYRKGTEKPVGFRSYGGLPLFGKGDRKCQKMS